MPPTPIVTRAGWVALAVVVPLVLVLAFLLSGTYTQNLANIATCVGAAVAGFWVYWTWRRAERLRECREVTAVEATIETKVACLDHGRCVVHVTMNWKNNGPDIITAVASGTKLEVYQIPPATQGPKFSPGTPITVIRPLEGRADEMTLEPATLTSLECVIVLENGAVYFLKAYLLPRVGTVEPPGWWWECTTIVELPSSGELAAT